VRLYPLFGGDIILKTIIAGSRTILNKEEIFYHLNNVDFTITEVICGGAIGPDTIGKQWAIETHTPYSMFPAHWDVHGKAAGTVRNKQMAEYADALVLFWDGKSPGSKNMLVEAKKRNLIIVVHLL
jgi:hypothetical protein